MVDVEANLDSMHPHQVASNNSPHNSPPPPQSNSSQNHVLTSSPAPPQSNPLPLAQVQTKAPAAPPKTENHVPPQRRQTPTSSQTGKVVINKILRETMPESLRIINLTLRLLAVVLTFISLIIIATNTHRISTAGRLGHSQVGDFKRGSVEFRSLGNKRKAHHPSASHAMGTSWIGFNSFSIYKYLLSACVIACLYSLVQLLSATYCLLTAKSHLLPIPFSYYVSFIFDQVCSYLLLSSSSASFSLSQALISSLGTLHGIHTFTSQANASASIGFLAFSVVSASSMISGFQVVLHLIS